MKAEVDISCTGFCCSRTYWSKDCNLKKRLLAVIPIALLTISYLISLENGLRDYIIESAEQFDVQLIYSWTWMWDFVVMAIFIVVALSIFFGKTMD